MNKSRMKKCFRKQVILPTQCIVVGLADEFIDELKRFSTECT